jgi:hypothetical protein
VTDTKCCIDVFARRLHACMMCDVLVKLHMFGYVSRKRIKRAICRCKQGDETSEDWLVANRQREQTMNKRQTNE